MPLEENCETNRWKKPPFGGEKSLVQNCRFRNIRIDKCGRNACFKQKSLVQLKMHFLVEAELLHTEEDVSLSR